MAKVLYISLTGMTEPLGRSQVLEYLIDLSSKNRFYLISFERKKDLKNIDEVKELVKKYNIEWHYFIYSNKYGIFSTLGQIFKVIKKGASLINNNSIEIIHARSFIPAVMGYGLKIFNKNVKLHFDVRGFSTKEKVDRGRLNQKSLLYKLLFWLENKIFMKSDSLNTLTFKARDILHNELGINKLKIEIIPTCANKDIFKILKSEEKIKFRKKLGYNENDIIFIHTGTVTGWYDYDKELILLKELMKKKEVKYLVLNINEKEFILEKLDKYKIDKNRVKILSASFDDVYKYLNIANASIFFIKPTEGKQASAPTKFAENVACYLPSITNSGVGDMEYYMTKYNVGVLLDLKQIEKDTLSIAEEIFQHIQEIDKESFDILFQEHFDKNIAIKKYNKIYKNLTKGNK